MAERLEVKGVRILRFEFEEVEGGEIARRVVEEHIFRARVRRDDRTRGRAGVPVVDRRVKLQSGVGAGPGGAADLVPQISRLHYLYGRSVKPRGQSPIAIGFNGPQKIVCDANRIVRVLPGDSEVGFRIPVGRKFCKIDFGLTLAGELDHPCDDGVRNVQRAARV